MLHFNRISARQRNLLSYLDPVPHAGLWVCPEREAAMFLIMVFLQSSLHSSLHYLGYLLDYVLGLQLEVKPALEGRKQTPPQTKQLIVRSSVNTRKEEERSLWHLANKILYTFLACACVCNGKL